MHTSYIVKSTTFHSRTIHSSELILPHLGSPVPFSPKTQNSQAYSMGNFLATPDHEESQSTTTTAPSVDRLTLLAGRIGNKTQVLTQGLRARGLLAPSYEVDGCADFPIQDLDAETAEARQEVLALTKELRDLVLGPREGLKLMAIDVSTGAFNNRHQKK